MVKQKLKRIFAIFISKLIPLVSWVTWDPFKALFNGGVYFNLLEEDWNYLEIALAKDYYVILTRNDTHLSTFFVGLGNWLVTRKWGFWSHALMNLEGDVDPYNNDEFRLMEATGKGVHWSSFQEVFRCDAVALLKPKLLTHDEWNVIMEAALSQPGKKYDNLFDLVDDQEMSCVELVRYCLQALPDYKTKFANLEKMIEDNKGQLTPDMFYNCPDFEVTWEIRR